MALQNYTKRALVERLMRDFYNGFPDSDATLSQNEVLLHVDQAIAYSMVGQAYNLAKLEGNLVTPEAYVSRFSLSTISKNESTGEWYATLPQPPVSLPLGYSITNVFFADTAYGKSEPCLPIETKRVPFRQNMPSPKGVRYWVMGSTIYLEDAEGATLRGLNLYVEMIKTRTVSFDEEMNMPDDAIEMVYNLVMAKLKARMMNPQDVIQDNLPTGNKTS
jgi:hypothetical protein